MFRRGRVREFSQQSFLLEKCLTRLLPSHVRQRFVSSTLFSPLVLASNFRRNSYFRGVRTVNLEAKSKKKVSSNQNQSETRKRSGRKESIYGNPTDLKRNSIPLGHRSRHVLPNYVARNFDNDYSGVTEVRKDKKLDRDSEFMKLWTDTEGQFKDRLKFAVKGSSISVPKRKATGVKTIDIPRIIGLPVTRKQLDLPDDDESVIFRIPSGKEFSGNQEGESIDGLVNLQKNPDESTLSFSDLGIHPKLCEKLQQYGITKPATIQKKSLPLIFKGNNVLIQSETGSGKTLVFLLPSIQDPGRAYGTVIVVPTRELASQIKYEAHRLLREKSIVASFVSGVELSNQEQRLRDTDRPPRIIIGTPKRLLQIVQANASLFQKTKRIVIDEVDKALQPLHRRASMKKIFSRASHPRPSKELVDKLRKASKVLQIQLIGATATVDEVLREDLRDLGWGDHVKIVQPPSYLGKHRSVPPCIAHQYVVYNTIAGVTKAQALARIFRKTGQKSALVFIHRLHSVDDFVSELRDLGLNAVALYQQVANQNPAEFEQFLNLFSTGKIQVVVGTEETVRGLDFKELDHVFLMEVPKNVDEYLHLSGRVGRQGRCGTTTTFVSKAVQGEERRLLLEYRRLGLNFEKVNFGQMDNL